MKRTILLDCITYFFILLFLYTGAAKLMQVHLFKEQLTSSPFLGSLASIITWALPIGEILLAIVLFIPPWRLKGLYFTFAIMAIFTSYVLLLLFIDDQLSCSCGGIIEELSPKQHVLFNSACLILSLVGILVGRRQQPSNQFKWLTATSAACLFLLVGWTLFTAFSAPAVEKTGMEGRLLPSFNLLLIDSTTHLNTADIPSGRPFIVVGFAPDCTHCQAETQDIVKHIQQFKDTRIYFVTPYPFYQMREFYQYFKLSKYPNVIMGRDTSNFFFPYFKTRITPYTVIFDAKKRLKKVMPGRAFADGLALAMAE